MNIILENIRYVRLDEAEDTVEERRPTPEEMEAILHIVDDALHTEDAVGRFSDHAEEVTDGVAYGIDWTLRTI